MFSPSRKTAFCGGPAPGCSALLCPCAENSSTETLQFPWAACPLALGKDQPRVLESGACQLRVRGLPWDAAPAVRTGTYDGISDDLQPKTSGTERFRAICEGTPQLTAPASRWCRARGGCSPPPAAPHRPGAGGRPRARDGRGAGRGRRCLRGRTGRRRQRSRSRAGAAATEAERSRAR